MAELSTLARPYAEAAFKRAKETNSVHDWSEILQFLSAIAKDSDLLAIINNPRVSKDRIMELLLSITSDQVHDEGRNLLRLLVANGKLALLPTISTLFEEHKADDEGYVNVELFSAYALSKAEQSQYSAMLEKQLQKRLILLLLLINRC